MTKDITIGIDDQLYKGVHDTLSAAELRKIVEEAIRKRMGETSVQEEWDAYLAKYRSQTSREEAMSAVSGMWKDRGIDGIEYQRNLRAEWDNNG